MKQLELLHKKIKYVGIDIDYNSEENLQWLLNHNYTNCIKSNTYKYLKTQK